MAQAPYSLDKRLGLSLPAVTQAQPTKLRLPARSQGWLRHGTFARAQQLTITPYSLEQSEANTCSNQTCGHIYSLLRMSIHII
jgi:hypothetical protein